MSKKKDCKGCKTCGTSCKCNTVKPVAFDQMESYSIDTMLKINQRLTQLKQQDDQQSFMINMLREKLKEVKSGKIKGPFFIQMGRNIFVPEPDRNKFLKNMSEQLNLLKNSNQTTKDQMVNVCKDFDKAIVAVSGQLSKRAESIKLPEEPKVILDTKPINKLTKEDKALIQKAVNHNTRKRANKK